MNKIFIPIFMAAVLFCTASCGNSGKKGNAESQQAVKSEAVAPVDSDTYVNVGDIAPDFTVEMLDGRKITLSELKGKVVLVTFWATWCPPCNMEFRAIPEKLLKPFGGNEDFVFLPISREETRETVLEKMELFKEEGVAFPVGIDPERKIYSQYAKQTIPRNYLIGKDGKVAYKTIGYEEPEFEELTAKISELL